MASQFLCRPFGSSVLGAQAQVVSIKIPMLSLFILTRCRYLNHTFSLDKRLCMRHYDQITHPLDVTVSKQCKVDRIITSCTSPPPHTHSTYPTIDTDLRTTDSD